MRGAEDNDFFAGGPIQPKARTYDWQGVEDVSVSCYHTCPEASIRLHELLETLRPQSNSIF